MFKSSLIDTTNWKLPTHSWLVWERTVVVFLEARLWFEYLKHLIFATGKQTKKTRKWCFGCGLTQEQKKTRHRARKVSRNLRRKLGAPGGVPMCRPTVAPLSSPEHALWYSFYVMTAGHHHPKPQVHVSGERLPRQFVSHSLPVPSAPSLHEASISWGILCHEQRLQMDGVCYHLLLTLPLTSESEWSVMGAKAGWGL